MGLHRPYKIRKFDVGERLLALRTQSGLSQAELAPLIGASRRSIQGWEAGATYPQEDNLQRLIGVFLTKGALTPGVEYNEAYALWQLISQDGGRRLARFDEKWFALLLAGYRLRDEQVSAQEPQDSLSSTNLGIPQFVAQEEHLPSIVDWGEAPDVSMLYGRSAEVATLQKWVIEDHCRIVALLGLGGIGKTSLAVAFANQAAPHFDGVFFRSLRNAPPLAHILDSLIRVMSPEHSTLPESVADKIALLTELFRERRYLVVLDNLETILQPGAYAGKYRTDYEDYGLLLQRLGEVPHGSCLLLTSREKPAELGPMEGRTAPVRSLALTGLAHDACRAILEEKELFGMDAEVGTLANLYGGNPLALKLISEPIHEVFGGNLHLFLSTGDAFFNGVGKLLDQQFQRSTATEQHLLYWLAIERDFVTFEALQANSAVGLLQRDILMALESLRRRLLIERRTHPPAFSLQPVLMEYLTDRLVEHLHHEIVHHETWDGQPQLLRSHAFVQASAKDHVRHTQERFIAMPLLEHLVTARGGAIVVEQLLVERLQQWRGQPIAEQGYGPGNVVNLLRLLRGHLRDLNLTDLAIRQTYLQGVEMQDTTLAGATIQGCVFTETFDALTAVATSGDGEHWAASSRSGKILLWSSDGHILERAWQAHPGMVPTLNFSPNGRTLATSGGWEGGLRLWNVEDGMLLWSNWHTAHVNSLAFCPDGSLIASSSDDETVGLWEVESGMLLKQLAHPAPVAGVAWSPDGTLLASSDTEGTIHIWAIQKNGSNISVLSLMTISGHHARVDALAFSPKGHTLASASWDGQIKVWEISRALAPHEVGARLLCTLGSHTDRVIRVVWSRDGQILASCGHNPLIWLWDVAEGICRMTLSGHSDGIYGVAFTANGGLLSSSDDGTLRLWDITRGQCLHVLQGYTASFYSVDWSPDSTQLVSGGTDRAVTTFVLDNSSRQRVLHGDGHIVLGVGWSHNGRWLASSEWDNIVRLWDARAGTLVHLLQNSEESNTYFSALAWGPDDRLACTTYRHGVLVWDMTTLSQRWFYHQRPTWIRCVAWSPDGRLLAGGDEQGFVYVWNADTGMFLRQMTGHHGPIMGVAWRPWNSLENTQLASAGHGIEGGELFVWDVQHGEPIRTVVKHSAIFCSVAWTLIKDIVVTGDDAGALRWWDMQQGLCIHECKGHQGSVQSLRRSPDGSKLASCGDDGVIMLWDIRNGTHLQTLRRDRPYERLDITGLKGLTDAQRASLLGLGAIELRY